MNIIFYHFIYIILLYMQEENSTMYNFINVLYLRILFCTME